MIDIKALLNISDAFLFDKKIVFNIIIIDSKRKNDE